MKEKPQLWISVHGFFDVTSNGDIWAHKHYTVMNSNLFSAFLPWSDHMERGDRLCTEVFCKKMRTARLRKNRSIPQCISYGNIAVCMTKADTELHRLTTEIRWVLDQHTSRLLFKWLPIWWNSLARWLHAVSIRKLASLKSRGPAGAEVQNMSVSLILRELVPCKAFIVVYQKKKCFRFLSRF